MKVNNKTIVVTGGGNGVGRQLVLALLHKGARVAAIDRSEAALSETAKQAGVLSAQLSCHTLDITDRTAVEALPKQILAVHGAVDGLINNAGIIQPFIPIAQLDYPAIEKVMQVNFYGTLYFIKTWLPYLLERPEAHIVNVSSMGGFLPVPGQSIYGASKAAVKLLTEGLRSELLDTSVGVTIVFPGALATDIAANSGAELKSGVSIENAPIKLTTPQKAAALIIEGIENKSYRVLIGNDARFLDFLYRLHPRFAAEFIYKQMKKFI